VPILALYALVVLIWGSTWAAIPYQLGEVAPELSVAYRFGIASIALYGYAVISRRRLRLPAETLPMVFVQGALLFSLNYFLVYYGTARITSGLVAVLFSSIVIMNGLFERLFFRTVIDARLVAAGVLGLAGMAMIFWPQVASISLADNTVVGILFVFASVITASLGNMTAVVNNTRRGLPVVAVNAHAMAFASVLSFLIAVSLGRRVSFSFETGYVVSLVYLAIFGSAIAFGGYLALIRRIGPARAAYSSVLFPIVALTISTLYEGYRWTPLAAVGIMLALVGNWLILTGRTKRINPSSQGTKQ
jgi:drug/metabolite transporter (DMT)-like permease